MCVSFLFINFFYLFINIIIMLNISINEIKIKCSIYLIQMCCKIRMKLIFNSNLRCKDEIHLLSI